jgi:hypothetical protein
LPLVTSRVRFSSPDHPSPPRPALCGLLRASERPSVGVFTRTKTLRPPEPLHHSPRPTYRLLCRMRTTKNPTAETMNMTVAARERPSARAVTAKANAAMAPSCRERASLTPTPRTNGPRSPWSARPPAPPAAGHGPLPRGHPTPLEPATLAKALRSYPRGAVMRVQGRRECTGRRKDKRNGPHQMLARCKWGFA